jgi:hypothetical protein
MELQSRAGAESAHALGCRRLRIPRAKYPRFEHDVCVQYIVEALLARPVSVAVAVSTPLEEGIPGEPGLYAWWAGANALPELVGTSHPHVAGLELLYVGICPDGVAGMRTIRDRLLRDHIRRTHRSTLRRALAAFLYVREGWTPGLARGGRPTLVAASETKLTAWMYESLQVSWAVCPRPWDIEAAVIRRLLPPLNSNHIAAHPANELVRLRREAWTAATRRALR